MNIGIKVILYYLFHYIGCKWLVEKCFIMDWKILGAEFVVHESRLCIVAIAYEDSF